MNLLFKSANAWSGVLVTVRFGVATDGSGQSRMSSSGLVPVRSQVELSLSREETFVRPRSALAKTWPERVSGLVRRPTSFRPRFSSPFGGREEEEEHQERDRVSHGASLPCAAPSPPDPRALALRAASARATLPRVARQASEAKF